MGRRDEDDGCDDAVAELTDPLAGDAVRDDPDVEAIEGDDGFGEVMSSCWWLGIHLECGREICLLFGTSKCEPAAGYFYNPCMFLESLISIDIQKKKLSRPICCLSPRGAMFLNTGVRSHKVFFRRGVVSLTFGNDGV